MRSSRVPRRGWGSQALVTVALVSAGAAAALTTLLTPHPPGPTAARTVVAEGPPHWRGRR
jgi:hypothetical protein